MQKTAPKARRKLGITIAFFMGAGTASVDGALAAGTAR
jgi:hypothetical protein